MGIELHVANAPVSWGITEVRGVAATLPFGTVLDEIAGCGYEATELGPFGYLPTDPARLHDELDKRSLQLTSAFVPLRLKDPDGVEDVIDQARTVGHLLAACGARYIVLADAMWPEREAVSGRAKFDGPQLSIDEWKTVAENIRRVAVVCGSLGLRCVFHHHAGTYVETPEEVQWLMEQVPEEYLGLCLDTGHFLYGGGDPVTALRCFGKRVEYLHFKDLKSSVLQEVVDEKAGFAEGVRRGVFCELGAGDVQFRSILAELDEMDYSGWAVVEQDVDLNDPQAPSPGVCARASREYIENLLHE